ncbi:hypothetical protein BH11BAC2_BH11BAC2_24500 [soil metagenome]
MKKSSAFTVLLLSLCLVFTSFKVPPPGLNVGDKAPDFKLKNVDGSMKSLADYKSAKGIILIFTCNHCPFSVAYEDRILALDQQYAPKGFPVVAINPNDAVSVPEDSWDNMVIRAKDKKFTFAYLYDEGQNIAQTYGAARTPHVFLLQKVGADFVVKYIGAIDDNTDNPDQVKNRYVEDAINDVLGGKPVAVPFTKAIGCTVKWKKA